MQPRIWLLLGKLDIAIHNAGLRRSLPAAQSQAERRRPIVHRAIFGHTRILGVLDNRKAQLSAQPQALAHDVVIENRPAVIGYSHRARALQAAKVREHRAFAGVRRGRNRKHVDHRASLRLAQPVHPLLRIDCRRCIRHAAHGREPARRSRRRAGRNRLFVCLPGLAQMDVQVNQSRSDDQPPGVEFFIRPAANFVRGRDLRHAPIPQHDIHRRIDLRGGIDHVSTFDQQRRRFGFIRHLENRL